MGWWCEVRGELTFLIAAPPWLLPSTSQQAASRVFLLPSWINRSVLAALVAANSKVPHAACSPTRMPVLGQQEGEPVQ